MVLPNDHVPVCAVIDVRLRPTVGYVCAACLSGLVVLEGGGGGPDVPFATTVVGAVRS